MFASGRSSTTLKSPRTTTAHVTPKHCVGWEGVAEPVKVTLYNDAGCPWGYSANPAFRVLEWRYGAQLEWRLVLIGLTRRGAGVRRPGLYAAALG